MLIALRDMSVGEHVVRKGDHLSAEVQSALPPGRVEALKAQRFVEEITDEQRVARAVSDVFDRIDRLEARVLELEGGVKVDGRTKQAREARAERKAS